MSDSLSKASLTYENFIIMGDFNININTAGMDVDKLEEFSNLFDLTNLIKTGTCCTKNHKSTIDLLLRNRPLSFQKTRTTKTGISDYHKLFKNLITHVQNPKLSITETMRILTRSFFLKILKIRTFQQTRQSARELC